ncbi:MAG: carboxylating nicotinate-nucleotide diphosphorylase [Myxococcota bacterium]|nr:carboxylating nicotinate-nucleotide diphosphorylase [Myxococcota bacterium]
MTIGLSIFEHIIDLAIEEDLGRGDTTTRLTVDPEHQAKGRAIARKDLVVSGGDIFEAVMRRVDPETCVMLEAPDGASVSAGDALLTAVGRATSLLMAERVALNFLQHLSGIATLTKRFVDALPSGSPVIVTDTRKTTPGLRFLERRAVLHGGGRNHRADLSGGILIKENHILGAGSIAAAVQRCRQCAPHVLKIEVEVRSETELKQALAAGADAVLLDNMDEAALKRCVAIARADKSVFVEASGGVSLDTISSIARTGVDAISVGALTHSAPAADISFLLDAE